MVNTKPKDRTTTIKTIRVIETPRAYSTCRMFTKCLEDIFNGDC